jgi:hypothetical protein
VVSAKRAATGPYARFRFPPRQGRQNVYPKLPSAAPAGAETMNDLHSGGCALRADHRLPSCCPYRGNSGELEPSGWGQAVGRNNSILNHIRELGISAERRPDPGHVTLKPNGYTTQIEG